MLICLNLLLDEFPYLAADGLASRRAGSRCRPCRRSVRSLGRRAALLGTRPLANLIELGYVRKEIPFGESERSSKRTLYRINDPFLSFFFRFCQPHRSLLELGLVAPVEARLKTEFPAHVAAHWEDLARQSVPFLPLGATQWGPAARWWGAGKGGGLEFDVVAESLDGKSVLIGEAKWSGRGSEAKRWAADLRERAEDASFVKGRKVVFALWIKKALAVESDMLVVTPEAVLKALR